MRRLLGLLVLIAVAAVAVYYWKYKPASAEHAAEGAAAEARQALDSVGQKLKETKHHGAVKAAFKLNRELAPLPIDVDSTETGVITLKGTVPSEDLRALAGRVAASVPDVSQVNNLLTVGTPGAAAPTVAAPGTTVPLGGPAAAGDRVQRVAAALRANASLSAQPITVRDEAGRLVLEGRVRTAAEKDLATLLARDAAGVPVDNRLVVGP